MNPVAHLGPAVFIQRKCIQSVIGDTLVRERVKEPVKEDLFLSIEPPAE
jgi:hypothetical protein